jgi:hypothetical protein
LLGDCRGLGEWIVVLGDWAMSHCSVTSLYLVLISCLITAVWLIDKCWLIIFNICL